MLLGIDSSCTPINVDVPLDTKTLSTVITKARLAATRGQNRQAIDHYERALELSETIKEFNCHLICEILEELAVVYVLVGNDREANFLRVTAEKLSSVAS